MNTIFMNSENSKTADSYRLLFSLLDKINFFKKMINMLVCQTLVFTIHGKKLKSHIKIINLKYQLQHGMNSLNYLMDHIRY